MFDWKRYRAFLSLVLAIALTLVVGCSSAPPPKPVYSPEQINLIGEYQSDLESLRGRIDELAELIDYSKWSDVESLIHGPLGDVRFKMQAIARNLSSSDQKTARSLAKEVFNGLVEVDAAATEQNKAKAFSGYDKLVAAYERFIDAIPQS